MIVVSLLLPTMQTLCALLKAVFQKKLGDSMSFDVIDVLIGFDSAECQMRVRLTTSSFYTHME